jgi:outer membrane protease
LKNNARGTGLGFDVNFIYKYTDNLNLILSLETKRFKMKKGTDQMFYNNAAFGGERVTNMKLLDLSFISSSVTAGLKYKL